VKTRNLKKASIAVLSILLIAITAFSFGTSSNRAFATSDVIVGLTEEKVYCKSTIEDDFADDEVLLVLNKAASFSFKEYSPADFPEVDCGSVEDLMSFATERNKQRVEAVKSRGLSREASVEAFGEINENYRTILSLNLRNRGKQNVLDAVKRLEKRAEILSASVARINIPALCAVPNDPSFNPNSSFVATYGTQWAVDKISLPQAWDITQGSSSVMSRCHGVTGT